MEKSKIIEYVNLGATCQYSHMLICHDTFDYTDYPVYVKYGEDVKKIIARFDNRQNMSKVMEIYNYNLDLEKQLNESRSYHIEPLSEEKNDSNLKENNTRRKVLKQKQYI